NVAILSVLAAGASAATHKIEVGKGGLTFNPDTVKAAKGDVVEFHFDSNHNVVAGNFKKPCNPLSSGGFFSGDLPSDDNTVFSVTINNTEPIFYYCGVGDHCQDGMVGVINQGSDETLDDYKSAAEKASSNVSPKSAYGG
ncbi:Cupredoxin, partial [Thelonectria olida]